MNQSASQLPPPPQAPLAVGVSQCLLGDAVRYDGTGAGSSFAAEKLTGIFSHQKFCPEVAIGMGVPRTPIRLVGDAENYRVVALHDQSMDKTQALDDYAQAIVKDVELLHGYIFMHNSPSCGPQNVKVYPLEQSRPVRRTGTGRFAKTIIAALPNLPVVAADQLDDDELCENFVTRVFVYAHWRCIVDDLTPGTLTAFNHQYEKVLMGLSMQKYEQTQRLLTQQTGNFEALAGAYISLFMTGLCK